MPKAIHLPTDPRFPAFRAVVEANYGGRLPDDAFVAGKQKPHEPYHTEMALAFRTFVAGWDAALATTPAAPAQVGAQPSELERLRNEVASLRVSLGQPADRPAEPIGCRAPGACSCQSAQPAPDMVQRHEKQLADWLDAHPVFGPAHRAYESSKAAQSAGRVENFIYEDVIANRRGEGPHRFVPEDGPGAQPAGRVEHPPIGAKVRVNSTCRYFADWQGIVMTVVGVRLSPSGEVTVDTIEGEKHRDGRWLDHTDGWLVSELDIVATPPTAGAGGDGGGDA